MTELCNGTLDDLVKGRHNGPPFVVSSWLIVYQIVVGLNYLHANNIIHRDLKPGNILFIIDVRNRPVMKLADFGCSRIVPEDKSHLTRTETKVGDYSVGFRPFGTSGWIAPEVVNDEKTYTDKVDIFPLGLIIAFTLSGGFHPFGDRTEMRSNRIRKGDPMLPEIIDQIKLTIGGGSSYELIADLIAKMLNPKPEERPSTDQLLQHEYLRIQLNPLVCFSNKLNQIITVLTK